MGSITISVDGGAGAVATKTFPVSNANIARLVAWSKGMQPGATNVQALERWAQWAMDMSKAYLMEDERRKSNIPDFD